MRNRQRRQAGLRFQARILTYVCSAAFMLFHQGDAFSAESTPRTAFNGIFGERLLASNVFEVRRRAAELPDAECFDFLSRWVLPSPLHSSIRLTGEFTQTRPADIAGHIALEGGSGGEIVSPVFDLLDLAARTGRIEELKKRIAAIPVPQSGLLKNSHTALLVLLNLEQMDAPAAEASLATLFAAVSKETPAQLYDQWPETLVAYRCVKRFPDFEPVSDLLGTLLMNRVHRGIPQSPSAHVWFVHIASLSREHQSWQIGQQRQRAAPDQAADRQLRNWIPLTREREDSCGRGFPLSSWQWDGRECQHVGGHDFDYVFFRSPLRGDFSVEADLRGFNTTQILSAGGVFGPRTPASIVKGDFRTGTVVEAIDPPLHRADHWIRYRSEIRNGVSKTWLNGRLVNVHELSAEYDPWVGVCSWSRTPGAVRDLRIIGSPEIPAAVVISDPECLSGWWGYHHPRIGGKGATWLTPTDAPDGAQIIGAKWALQGAAVESLLRYHRPLMEDGTIDYEFFYNPGQSVTHPALDRLAFLLEPGGVRLHWITDGRFERSSLGPDNSFPVSELQNAPGPLPLKADTWNSMQLAITGQTLSLILNGERILERELEESNSRQFGLFHYADRSAVRVRNVIMSGDWPLKLPAVAEQQLADSVQQPFDDALANLAPVFSHNFVTDGLPDAYFEFADGTGMGQHTVNVDGVNHVQESDGPVRQSTVNTRLSLYGDFDVTADFADLDISAKQICGAELHVEFAGEFAVRVKRRWQEPNLQRLVVDWAIPPEPGIPVGNGGRLRTRSDYISTEALGGRLRVVRHGDMAYVLFAEHDSTQFRLVASHTFATLSRRSAVVRLAAVANQSGSTRVTWKRLRIGAERIMIVPDRRTSLYVMNADGSELRRITTPNGNSVYGDASPDWSPKGDLIAFDSWMGAPATSRMYLARPDGTGLTDLGYGLMPTFSSDGKRLTFSWAGQGMATMDLKGEDRELVEVGKGWGAQWSPDGKSIAYHLVGPVDGSESINLATFDIKSKEKRMLLEGDQAQKYQGMYWNMAWSPDSRQIAFKCLTKDGKSEIAVTSVDGSSKDFRVLMTENIDPDLAWNPDGKGILFAKYSRIHSGKRLFVYDLATSEVSLLENQPMDQDNSHGAWSRDGQRLVFSSRCRDSGPVQWQPEQPQ